MQSVTCLFKSKQLRKHAELTNVVIYPCIIYKFFSLMKNCAGPRSVVGRAPDS